MTDYSQYSLSGCLIDESYVGPQLASLGGDDPLGTIGDGADPLPPKVDLRQWCSAVEDQRSTNSCVANAVVGALELLQRKESHSSQDLSRSFVYFNSRKLHNFEHHDKGTLVHFAMAAIIAHGICEERLWPFSEVTINDPPTEACFANAQNYRGVEFALVQKGTPLTHVLARGLPLVIAVKLPREAYDIAARTGTMQLPEGGGGATHQHGNHAMAVVGYDLDQKAYLVRNSWGQGWAQGGYFWMPFAIFDAVSFDGQTWAIGSLGRAPGLKLLGAGVAASAEQLGRPVAPPLQQDPGKAVREELQGGIDKAREGFAGRLRGK